MVNKVTTPAATVLIVTVRPTPSPFVVVATPTAGAYPVPPLVMVMPADALVVPVVMEDPIALSKLTVVCLVVESYEDAVISRA